jgi:hypothetical protein
MTEIMVIVVLWGLSGVMNTDVTGSSQTLLLMYQI